jgi:ABC-type branched-subunit amino acid transport system substrate-binding protein
MLANRPPMVVREVLAKYPAGRDRNLTSLAARRWAPRVERRPSRAAFVTSLTLAIAALGVGCGNEGVMIPSNAIVIGSLLPFTGQEAALGNNLEQAILLAVEDINAAGGVHGRPLALVSRDSNSGSERGLDALLNLLYVDQVRYLIGPEENDLANQIVPDIKGLDVLNMLPGYTAPSVKRISSSGAWMRLAPSPGAVACGMAARMTQEGVKKANAIVAIDDYNQSLASQFNAQFARLGGELLPSVTVATGQESYASQITQVFSYGADRTLLIAFPSTASTIVTQWGFAGGTGAWFLSPTLEATGFLLNVPLGAMEGQIGLSPSLSLRGECVAADIDHPERLTCVNDNAARFGDHFATRWGGPPFPAAHFYYDAVVLLAMGLEFDLARNANMPSALALQQTIRALATPEAAAARWSDLRLALELLRGGSPVRYVGAAAEYDFDDYGAARHVVFDTWRIEDQRFVATESLKADCPQTQ